MLLLWTTIWLYVQQCVLGAPGPGHPQDIMLEMLQSRYKTETIGGSRDAGEPLFLTPYLLDNRTAAAREAARVDADLFLGKESYAGYLTVNKEYNANLFFWYFPVSGKPVQATPWILWLQGGPGCSSLFGLFTEIGPFTIKDEKLEETKYSWGNEHSLLFIDNPVGAGFSFTEDQKGYATHQTMIGENLYSALQQFLTIFPELRSAPLTIAGESYAGKHIPSIGIQIHRNQNDAQPINLHGLAIGNGLIDPATLASGYGDFLREVGLVDDQQADEIKTIEGEIRRDIKQDDMYAAKDDFDLLLTYYHFDSHLSNVYNYLDDNMNLYAVSSGVGSYVQQGDIRRALHVGNNEFDGINGHVYQKLIPDIMQSAKPWLEELLDNYKVMLYNGHLDVIVGYRPSVHTYNALNFSGAAEYRASEREAWRHDHFVAGYYKKGGNLLEVMVRGAGHMVPTDKPSAALGLISAFVRGVPLSEDTGRLARGAGSRTGRPSDSKGYADEILPF